MQSFGLPVAQGLFANSALHTIRATFCGGLPLRWLITPYQRAVPGQRFPQNCSPHRGLPVLGRPGLPPGALLPDPGSVAWATSATADREARKRQKALGKQPSKSSRRTHNSNSPPALALETLFSHSQPVHLPSLQANQEYSPDVAIPQELLAEEVGLGLVSPSDPSGVGLYQGDGHPHDSGSQAAFHHVDL